MAAAGKPVLAKRIIPCLDVTAGRVVKGINFVGLRDAGDPVEIAALQRAGRRRADLPRHHRHQRRPRPDPAHHRRRGQPGLHPADRGRRRAQRGRCAAPAQRRRRQGELQLRRCGRARPHPRRERQVRCPVHRGRHRRPSAAMATTSPPEAPAGTSTPTAAARHRLDAVAWARQMAEFGAGDPADQHGPRRHQERLRPGADPRRV